MYNWVLECVSFLHLNKIMLGILEINSTSNRVNNETFLGKTNLRELENILVYKYFGLHLGK